jgi:hypothetical protein
MMCWASVVTLCLAASIAIRYFWWCLIKFPSLLAC